MGNFITEGNLDAMWLNFNQRILDICHHYHIQKKDIASKIGVTPSRLSQRMDSAQHTIAYLILIYYPEINARWLLFGQGDMIDKPTPKPYDSDDLPLPTAAEEAAPYGVTRIYEPKQPSAEYQSLLDRYTALAIENQMLKNQLNKQ